MSGPSDNCDVNAPDQYANAGCSITGPGNAVGDAFNNNGNKEFFLQGVTFDTVGGNVYQKIVQAKSGDPYRYFILPFFPMSFIEFGNVQGIITYTKIKGIEKGTKREIIYF